MAQAQARLYTAPLFLGTAFLLFGVAVLEKVLNLFGGSIPILNVEARQILEWAVILLMFEIALTLRQLVELRHSSGDEPQEGGVPRGIH